MADTQRTSLLLLAALLVIVASVRHDAPLPSIQVDPQTQHFIDEFGRVRFFRGVNVVYKVPPFLPFSRISPISILRTR